MGVIVHCRY